jgi:hypothetical protein
MNGSIPGAMRSRPVLWRTSSTASALLGRTEVLLMWMSGFPVAPFGLLAAVRLRSLSCATHRRLEK